MAHGIMRRSLILLCSPADKQKALQLVEESKKRLDSQITKEGQWPLELERTNALGYSTFNTTAWF